MDKISGIIPSSPRLQAVDLKDSPVRPGTPSFGRPEGVSSLRNNQMPGFETTAMKSVGVHNQMMDWRSKEQRNASIAAEMSNRFFMKKEAEAQTASPVDVTNGTGAYVGLPVGLTPVQSRPAGFKTDDLTGPRESVRPAPVFETEEDEAEEPIELQQPEGLYPKGSFIDRTV